MPDRVLDVLDRILGPVYDGKPTKSASSKKSDRIVHDVLTTRAQARPPSDAVLNEILRKRQTTLAVERSPIQPRDATLGERLAGKLTQGERASGPGFAAGLLSGGESAIRRQLGRNIAAPRDPGAPRSIVEGVGQAIGSMSGYEPSADPNSPQTFLDATQTLTHIPIAQLGRLSTAGKFAATEARDTARTAAPKVASGARRLATEEAGFARIPGRPIKEMQRDLAVADEEITKAKAAISAGRKAGIDTSEADELLKANQEYRRSVLEGILSDEELTRLRQVEDDLRNIRNHIDVLRKGGGQGPAPKFGSAERVEWDRARKAVKDAGGKVAQPTGEVVKRLTSKARSLEVEYKKLLKGGDVPDELPPVAQAPDAVTNVAALSKRLAKKEAELARNPKGPRAEVLRTNIKVLKEQISAENAAPVAAAPTPKPTVVAPKVAAAVRQAEPVPVQAAPGKIDVDSLYGMPETPAKSPDAPPPAAASAVPSSPAEVPPSVPRPPAPPAWEPPLPTDPVAKLTNIIRAAKPVRAATEALKTAELGRRVAQASASLKGAGSARGGFKTSTRSLAGELPKAQFDAPESGLLSDEIETMFQRIRESHTTGKVQYLSAVNTSDALEKVLMGVLPTEGDIALLEKMFGSDLAKALLDKRSFGEKALEAIGNVGNIPRTLMSGFDMSAPLRQGLLTSIKHPVAAARAVPPMFKSWWKEGHYQVLDDAIRADPAYALAERAGLYLPDISKKATNLLSKREEAFASTLVQKVPVLGGAVRKSERAYAAYLNKLRFDVFKVVTDGWQGAGKAQWEYDEMAKLLNASTGRGSLGKADKYAPLLNAAFFAPRFLVSRFQVPAMLFSKSSAVRSEAALELLATVGLGAGILWMGKQSGAWDVETDARSSDFGKGRVGNTRFDFWAGYQPIARYGWQAITGQTKTSTGNLRGVERDEIVMRYLRSKSAPLPGLGVDVLKGEDFVGEPMDLKADSLRHQAYSRLVPLFIQDVADAAEVYTTEGGINVFNFKPKSALKAAPAFFGAGVQTYGKAPVQKNVGGSRFAPPPGYTPTK